MLGDSLGQPYKITPGFDEVTLPAALRSEHRTKEGVWGVLHVLAGRVTLVFVDPHKEVEVTPPEPAIIAPQATHFLRLDGPVRCRVEFYRACPDLD